MKITNKQHVTLHKEAQEVLEQAERKYWERAVIWFEEPRKLAPVHRHPYITLYHGDTVLNIETQPGYVTQTIFGVAEIRWNHPILNPRQVKQLIGLIKRDSVVQQDDPAQAEYEDDPATVEYQHIKEQWANRPEAQ